MANRGGTGIRRLFSERFFSQSVDTPAISRSTRGEGKNGHPEAAEVEVSRGIGDGERRHAQAVLKKQQQVDRGAHGVGAAM